MTDKYIEIVLNSYFKLVKIEVTIKNSVKSRDDYINVN